jgi:hypothetical protein
MNHLLCIAAPLALAAAATAQTGQVTHTLRWMEVNPATNTPVPNPNGILEPGEGARIMLDLSFTPQVGSPLAYGSPPTNVGVVRGLRHDFFDLWGSGGTEGNWMHRARHPILPLGDNGYIMGDGSLAGVQVVSSQPGSGPWLPDPMNPINVAWQGVWIPSSYTPRLSRFQTARVTAQFPHGNLWVQDGFDPTTGDPLLFMAWAERTFSSVQIPIVPSPATSALLIGAGLLAPRRRRDRSQGGV